MRDGAALSQHVWCPHSEDHTPCPEGYIAWHAWAAAMSKTHRPTKCGECGLWSIWVPKPSTPTADRTSKENGNG